MKGLGGVEHGPASVPKAAGEDAGRPHALRLELGREQVPGKGINVTFLPQMRLRSCSCEAGPSRWLPAAARRPSRGKRPASQPCQRLRERRLAWLHVVSAERHPKGIAPCVPTCTAAAAGREAGLQAALGAPHPRVETALRWTRGVGGLRLEARLSLGRKLLGPRLPPQ